MSTLVVKIKKHAAVLQGFYKKYAKFLIFALAAVLSASVGLIHTGMLPSEWVNVAIISVGSLSILTAPNMPGAKYTKEIIAALTAALTIASVALTTGFDFTSSFQMLFVVIGAIGVGGVKNIGDVFDIITTNVKAPVALPVKE